MRNGQLLVLLSVAVALTGCSKKAATTQEQLDRKFEETMKGVTLVGRSTRLQDDKIIGEEKYVIEGVSKLAGDTWLFRTRLQYGGHDIPLPLPVTIKWAGDTPVITLTDLSIPGMGTYTARSSFTETNMPEPGVVRRAAVRSSARSSAIPSLLISGRRPQS